MTPKRRFFRKDAQGRRVVGENVNTKHTPYLLDPKNEHATQPWTGTRWCLLCYTSRAVKDLDADMKKFLDKLGFPLPPASEFRTFGSSKVVCNTSSMDQEPRNEVDEVGSKCVRTLHVSSGSSVAHSSSARADSSSDSRCDTVRSDGQQVRCPEAQGGVCERNPHPDRLGPQELRKHNVERLKQIWTMVRPRKPQSPLPTAWKKLDVTGLKEIYEREVCPDLGRPLDGHWSRWHRPQLVTEIEMWHTEVMDSQAAEELFSETPMCSRCKIPMVIRTNRLSREDFFRCIRFPYCKETLPLTYAGHPTKEVQDHKYPVKKNEDESKKGYGRGKPSLRKTTALSRPLPEGSNESRGDSSDGSWIQTGRQPVDDSSDGTDGKKTFNTNVSEEELKILQELRSAKASKEK